VYKTVLSARNIIKVKDVTARAQILKHFDRWAESVNARLPVKTTDIFNKECKWRVNYYNLIFFLNCSHIIVFTINT
jgi:hypothetical protein